MQQDMSEDSGSIVGAWKLNSFEIQKADGQVLYPFGEDAHGSLM